MHASAGATASITMHSMVQAWLLQQTRPDAADFLLPDFFKRSRPGARLCSRAGAPCLQLLTALSAAGAEGSGGSCTLSSLLGDVQRAGEPGCAAQARRMLVHNGCLLADVLLPEHSFALLLKGPACYVRSTGKRRLILCLAELSGTCCTDT